MPEHTIRLRGGWRIGNPLGEKGERVTLPFSAWPAHLSTPTWFVRDFQGPRIDPARESIYLQILETPGITQISLNDAILSLAAVPDGDLEAPISPLPGLKNRLVLRVDGVNAAACLAAGAWGQVALVIREVLPNKG